MTRTMLGDALAPYEQESERLERILQGLMNEGFVKLQKDYYKLA